MVNNIFPSRPTHFPNISTALLLLSSILIRPSFTAGQPNVEIGESLKSIDLRPCFEKKRLTVGFSSPSLVAAPSSKYKKWCLRAITDRNSTDKRVIDFSAWVEFSWYRLDYPEEQNRHKSISRPSCVHGDNEEQVNASFTVPRCRHVWPVCKVLYEGFRGEYRLSPDFGGYPACSRILERYFFKLHQQTSIGKTSESHSDSTGIIKQNRGYQISSPRRGCPLKTLPFTLDDFDTCTLQPQGWYLLNFRSEARWEDENGTLHEGIGGENRRILRTFESNDDIYTFHSQITNCQLKVIILLKYKLPFALRIRVDVQVKNEENTVRQIYQQDEHVIQMGDLGKEFTYGLPDRSRVVRYCQKIEATLQSHFHIALPGVMQTCVARSLPNCQNDEKPVELTITDGESNQSEVCWIMLVCALISVQFVHVFSL